MFIIFFRSCYCFDNITFIESFLCFFSSLLTVNFMRPHFFVFFFILIIHSVDFQLSALFNFFILCFICNFYSCWFITYYCFTLCYMQELLLWLTITLKHQSLLTIDWASLFANNILCRCFGLDLLWDRVLWDLSLSRSLILIITLDLVDVEKVLIFILLILLLLRLFLFLLLLCDSISPLLLIWIIRLNLKCLKHVHLVLHVLFVFFL